jgi:hypothetical protein
MVHGDKRAAGLLDSFKDRLQGGAPREPSTTPPCSNAQPRAEIKQSRVLTPLRLRLESEQECHDGFTRMCAM